MLPTFPSLNQRCQNAVPAQFHPCIFRITIIAFEWIRLCGCRLILYSAHKLNKDHFYLLNTNSDWCALYANYMTDATGFASRHWFYIGCQVAIESNTIIVVQNVFEIKDWNTTLQWSNNLFFFPQMTLNVEFLWFNSSGSQLFRTQMHNN